MSSGRIKGDAAFHSFDAEIAMQVGINAAVVYRNLVFWVRHNEANRKNFHEGQYWTYNSLTAFDEQFPYLTAKQIRTALDKLLDAGLIVKGHFHEDKFKRASWYALGGAICPQGQMDQPEQADDTLAPEGSTSALEGKCIENRSVPDSKPNCLGVEAQKRPLEIGRILDAYPADRRRDDLACQGLIVDAAAEVGAEALLDAVQAYSRDSAHHTRSMVSFSDNWFRARKWESYVVSQHDLKAADASSAALNLARTAEWIRSRPGLWRHLSAAQVRQAVDLGLVSLDEAGRAGFCIQGHHV